MTASTQEGYGVRLNMRAGIHPSVGALAGGVQRCLHLICLSHFLSSSRTVQSCPVATSLTGETAFVLPSTVFF